MVSNEYILRNVKFKDFNNSVSNILNGNQQAVTLQILTAWL